MSEPLILQPLVDAVVVLQESFAVGISVYHEGEVWEWDGDELTLNADGDVNSLENRDGATYSWDTYYRDDSEDGWVMFRKADACCGYTETIIVKKDGEVV